MDWIIWLVVIVAIVAIVWWLLNRKNARGNSDVTGTATGTGTASRAPDTGAADKSAPPHVHDAREEAGHEAGHRGALSGGGAAASASAAGVAGLPTAAGFNQAEPVAEPEARRETRPDGTGATGLAAAPQAPAPGHAAAGEAPSARSSTEAPSRPGAGGAPSAGSSAHAETAPTAENPEWETQWSETPAAEPHTAGHPEAAHGAHGDHVKEAPAAGSASAAGAPVHHPEFTEPHAPTLPGAESAAAEAEAETVRMTEREETARSSPAGAGTRQAMFPAVSATPPGQTAEPAGHLSVDQPYGEGSAAPAADGSGPEGFTVKGNASSMIYHDETSPAFEETRAEVWFLSSAHAEAAGFRPPRRTRQ